MTIARLLLAAALFGGPAPLFAQGEANIVEPVKKPAKKKPAKKAYDYDRSKYKSRELAEGEVKTYRFNERGEPVLPADKKKKAMASKKKRAEPPEEKAVERGCSEEKPCANPDEADAL